MTTQSKRQMIIIRMGLHGNYSISHTDLTQSKFREFLVKPVEIVSGFTPIYLRIKFPPVTAKEHQVFSKCKAAMIHLQVWVTPQQYP